MDDGEFDVFYAASVRTIIGQLYTLTGDLTEAQECAHEAFATGWAQRHDLAASGSPEAWVRAIAWQLAVTRRRTPVRPGGMGRRDAIALGQDDVALVDALQRLDRRHREAIVLRQVCELPVDDVAHLTRQRARTVSAHLTSGRRALATLLTEPAMDDGTGPVMSMAGATASASEHAVQEVLDV